MPFLSDKKILAFHPALSVQDVRTNSNLKDNGFFFGKKL
jgi:hypothetical protein